MKRKELIANLEKFGLTHSEAQLYLAGIEVGETLVAPLAIAAGIPRTTTYAMLEEMIKRNLFYVRTRGKRTYYLAASPKQILKDVLDKEQLIRSMIPHLEALTDKKCPNMDVNVGELKTPLPLD